MWLIKTCLEGLLLSIFPPVCVYVPRNHLDICTSHTLYKICVYDPLGGNHEFFDTHYHVAKHAYASLLPNVAISP